MEHRLKPVKFEDLCFVWKANLKEKFVKMPFFHVHKNLRLFPAEFSFGFTVKTPLRLKKGVKKGLFSPETVCS